MQTVASGNIRKMKTTHSTEQSVGYQLPIGDALVDMNELIGKQIGISYDGLINCVACGRKSNKSFSQGYCYPCFRKLAQCDSCIMSPEKCHFDDGTCREPEWGEANCNIEHIVYLANSSGLKVGITRGTQVPTRWMDQGAIQALPIARVATRQLSGLVEVLFKEHTADKTNWRKMLKNDVEVMDLASERDRLLPLVKDGIEMLRVKHGIQSVTLIDNVDAYSFLYPVTEYPVKVTSFNLEKTPEISGKLMGIKGQYLILDSGVINLRKYTAYDLKLLAE